ncbi:MAG: helix-turn-helix domain-containing protein [Candidatus Gastranaerophilales bacterium]|nr:helix-turn-helix domain-containing protein [Candidatus Gastranaerophilales bacterium]
MQGIFDKNRKLIRVIGEIVKEHRKITGKSMYCISAEILMSKSTWRDVENGNAGDINLSTLWRIAEGLEILPEQLILEVRQRLGKDFSLTELN